MLPFAFWVYRQVIGTQNKFGAGFAPDALSNATLWVTLVWDQHRIWCMGIETGAMTGESPTTEPPNAYPPQRK